MGVTKALEENAFKKLVGKIASAGYTGGRCVIYNYNKEPPKEIGYVLVAKFTVPEMLPWIIDASGIITETGGILSHAAIIAREMRKPCIVGVEKATQELADSDYVIVDARGEEGMIQINMRKAARNNLRM